jgi:hypothetical protein
MNVAHYPPVSSSVEDHTLISFRTPMPTRPAQRPQQQIRSDCELGHGGYFIAVLILTAAQVPAAVQEDLDDDSEMWNIFLDDVKEEDIRFTDAWKDDASSIVTFVSHNPLSLCPSR